MSNLNTVLVIGSNSFSGSNFIKFLLKKKYSVIAVSRSNQINNIFLSYRKFCTKKNFKFFKIDLNKDLIKLKKIILLNRIKYVVNFSAQSMVNESWNLPEDWYLTNTLSQVKLFQILRSNKYLRRYLHVTTPEVYGSIKKIRNEWSFNPTTPYAISRSASDIHLLNLFKFFNFPVIFSRAANVYGPGQQLFRIIPKTLIMIKKNKKIPLDGGGKSKRSFIFIDDAVEAYYRILFKGKLGKTYFISNQKLISIKNLVKLICKIKKRSFQKSIINLKKDRVGKDKIYKLNPKETYKDLKWISKISLEKGLELTDKWVKENFNKIKHLRLNYKHKK